MQHFVLSVWKGEIMKRGIVKQLMLFAFVFSLVFIVGKNEAKAATYTPGMVWDMDADSVLEFPDGITVQSGDAIKLVGYCGFYIIKSSKDISAKVYVLDEESGEVSSEFVFEQDDVKMFSVYSSRDYYAELECQDSFSLEAIPLLEDYFYAENEIDISLDPDEEELTIGPDNYFAFRIFAGDDKEFENMSVSFTHPDTDINILYFRDDLAPLTASGKNELDIEFIGDARYWVVISADQEIMLGDIDVTIKNKFEYVIGDDYTISNHKYTAFPSMSCDNKFKLITDVSDTFCIKSTEDIDITISDENGEVYSSGEKKKEHEFELDADVEYEMSIESDGEFVIEISLGDEDDEDDDNYFDNECFVVVNQESVYFPKMDDEIYDLKAEESGIYYFRVSDDIVFTLYNEDEDVLVKTDEGSSLLIELEKNKNYKFSVISEEDFDIKPIKCVTKTYDGVKKYFDTEDESDAYAIKYKYESEEDGGIRSEILNCDDEDTIDLHLFSEDYAKHISIGWSEMESKVEAQTSYWLLVYIFDTEKENEIELSIEQCELSDDDEDEDDEDDNDFEFFVTHHREAFDRGELDASGNLLLVDKNFPDAAFRAYLKKNFDKDGDGKLSIGEADNVLKIVCSDVVDFTGLDFFINLQSLDTCHNEEVPLDLSENKELVFLTCCGKVPYLNLENNDKLKVVNTFINSLQYENIKGKVYLDKEYTVVLLDYEIENWQAIKADIAQEEFTIDASEALFRNCNVCSLVWGGCNSDDRGYGKETYWKNEEDKFVGRFGNESDNALQIYALISIEGSYTVDEIKAMYVADSVSFDVPDSVEISEPSFEVKTFNSYLVDMRQFVPASLADRITHLRGGISESDEELVDGKIEMIPCSLSWNESGAHIADTKGFIYEYESNIPGREYNRLWTWVWFDYVVSSEEVDKTSISAELKAQVAKAESNAPDEGKIVTKSWVYDANLWELVESKWAEVDPANFPEEGVLIEIPYPEGTDENTDFKIAHVFTKDYPGYNKGQIEYPELECTESGISFVVHGFSPVVLMKEEKHTHQGTKVAGKAATCEIDGYKVCYKCGCGKVFSDTACKNLIENVSEWRKGAGKIPAKGHTKTKTVSKTYLKSAATCEKAAVYYYQCSTCKNKLTETYTYGKALGHKLVTRTAAATTKADGSVTKTCSVCKKKISTTKINRAYIIAAETVNYTGKAVKPAIKVVDVNGKAISTSFYKITYKNNVNVGKGTATIAFSGNYKGSASVTFYVVNKKNVPATVSGVKLTAGSKRFVVQWKPLTKVATGYVIQYSTDKNFISGVKTVSIGSAKTKTKTITGLKTGTYYVRIRAVGKDGKVKTYSSWTSVKTPVKVK